MFSLISKFDSAKFMSGSEMNLAAVRAKYELMSNLVFQAKQRG